MGTRTFSAGRRVVVVVALVIGTVLVLGGSPAGAAVTPKPTTVGPPTSEWSWAARVLAPTAVRVQPDPASKAIGVLQPIAPLAKGPMVLLVLDTRMVGDVEWTKLLLARRPNGSSGWVPADVLRFRLNAMRITIDQSERRTFVHRNGKVILTVRNAVGTPSTPTPLGHFAIAEKIAIPSGFLGPFVMPTTGFSNVLNEYAGGNGRFALHGTSLPWLIGTRASHGCIRHRNADILSIARLVSPGTPILIRP